MTKRQRIQTKISERRARRKEERQAKKKRPRITSTSQYENQFVQKQERQTSLQKLEEKAKGSKKKKVNLLHEKNEIKKRAKKKEKQDLFDYLDEETAAAIKKDDEEIAFLEKNLGLAKSAKDKKKLHKEYAKLEGYGDDFGDFLDGLDGMLDKITGSGDSDNDEDDYYKKMSELSSDVDEYDSDISEEIVPMKSDDDNDDDKSDTELDESLLREVDNEQFNREDENESDENNDSDDNSLGSDSDDSSYKKERDHDEKDTYRPIKGQDLYGNIIDPNQLASTQPKKYVPPHLRRKLNQQDGESTSSVTQESEVDPERKENLRSLERLLNNSFNRLAENTIESVAKSITSVYNSNEYSSRDTNEGIWKNLNMACVVEHMIRESLIPLYVCCLSGLHFQMGDAIQLGSDIVERSVLSFWDELQKQRAHLLKEGNGLNKNCSNYLLILCYFYNYGVVHCTLIYDLIRKFIESFTEIDVELLLLILSHCGQQLRSDDPTALKDIVILVQKRSLDLTNTDEDKGKCSSSRAQFMLTTMTDLKNNKRKAKDLAINQKTSEYRKIIGRMKSTANANKDGKASSNSFKFNLQDIFLGSMHLHFMAFHML